MEYKIVQEQIEKLSCDLVLADPQEPESLSGLLPILKQIHGNCMKLTLKETATMILKARKIIDDLLKENPEDVDTKMSALNDLVSEISSSVSTLKQSEQDLQSSEPVEDSAKPLQESSKPVEGSSEPARDDASPEVKTDQIQERLNEFELLIRGFCPGDIPDLGLMLNTLDQLIELSQQQNFNTLLEIATASKEYVENMTLENIHNTKPIEEGLLLLKSVYNCEKKGKVFGFDYSDVLDLLNINHEEAQKISEKKEPVSEDDKTEKQEPEEQKPEMQEPAKEEPKMEKPEEPREVSEDDMEILVDFISEAGENLDSIEINLIELEQDPENKDIINDIFRPFHTIKGVSGFLSLTKINKLSHATENFLDSARSGDFIINDTATDVILESVDTLKQLLDKVQEGTETGFIPPSNEINIEALSDKLKKLQAALASGDTEPIGEILVQKGNLTSQDLDQALETQKDQPDKKIGEILIDENKVAPTQVASALMKQKQAVKQVKKQPAATQVKVSTQKLDDLVDFAGELVIAQSMLKQKTVNDSDLSQSVTQLGQIVSNMQVIAMSMRMIPIKATFMKMIRLVRDLSRKSGKQINLTMEGEDTEIDRNVVDALYEPMVHMIRNSCDHGIEENQFRLEQGKPSQGEVVLRAYHKGGHIIIEIDDDGKGLDKDRILEKAMSTGLITSGDQMTDAQIYDLIMQPGFSTAKEITDVSGRGVGMDVVRSGIERFRGQLNIESEKGKGSKFTISFPLTLAIIDGMLVRVEDERYVIPTMAIQKAFKPADDEYYTVEGKSEMIKDRGNLVPLIRLHEMFGSNKGKKDIQDSIVVVVESKDEKRALLVDELLGKDEYVIKSLGNSLENIDGLAGGAILADGRVGLILDIHGIFKLVSKE
ncbi:chemotaxis protein CheA [Desulfobacterales bacterium HSG17]|nr:chemotaxis protein CheA [Desulfobacterales bacterium HSG17]